MRIRFAIGVVVTVALLLAVMRTAGDAGYWNRYLTALGRGDAQLAAGQIAPRLRVAGGAALAPPRATAESEQLADEAITAALAQAAMEGARALVIHRHGHLVAGHFGDGITAETHIAGGDMAPLPLALALAAQADAGVLDAGVVRAQLRGFMPVGGQDWRNPWSAQARRRFSLHAPSPPATASDSESLPELVSQRVWMPLGAADAAMGGVDPRSPSSCCFVARLQDWMRVADLLLQEGRYAGEIIVSPQWTRELLWRNPASVWTGDEPPAANETTWMDLEPDARLWLLPQRGLAILHWAGEGSGRASDTTLPNIVIRGMVDQAQAPAATPLQDLVPEHGH